MFYALGIRLGRLGRNPERAQDIDHQAVAHPHAVGQRLALLGQKYPPIRACGRQPGAFQREIVFTAVACDTPSRRAISVGRASPAPVSRSAISST